mgnify:CR=1 FL=1
MKPTFAYNGLNNFTIGYKPIRFYIITSDMLMSIWRIFGKCKLYFTSICLMLSKANYTLHLNTELGINK